MSGQSESRWYFDAVAPWDGIAFASFRPENSDQADELVYLAPPEFTPVPVSRISTSWAAARNGGFESRLGGNTREDGFDSLDDLIEFTRRLYRRGGGGGPGMAPGGLPDAPTDEGPQSPEGGARSSPENDEQWNRVTRELRQLTGLELPGSVAYYKSREPLAEALLLWMRGEQDPSGEFPRPLPILQAFQVSLFQELLVRVYQETSPAEVWLRLLGRWTGIVCCFDPFLENLAQSMQRERGSTHYLLDFWMNEFRFAYSDGLYRGAASDLAFPAETFWETPFPRLWPHPTDVRSLGDYLSIYTSDRIAIRDSDQEEALAPVLLCAMALSASSKGSIPWPGFWDRGRKVLRDAIMEAAARWVSQVVPDDRLKKYIFAEQTIHDARRSPFRAYT